MRPSTKGIVDVVFCLDASGSMAPCIAGVTRHIGAFLDGLAGDENRTLDCRFDFLAHSCDEAGNLFRSNSLRCQGLELIGALYGQRANPGAFFTAEAATLKAALNTVPAFGDEAILVALDLCLDYPWRPRDRCHRVVVVLTDEPLETNAAAKSQHKMIGAVIDKIHALGVLLFLVGPESAAFNELAEADKSQYQRVAQAGDGLGTLDFARVFAHIGKSVSVAALQVTPDRLIKRALFGQDRWVATQGTIGGGR